MTLPGTQVAVVPSEAARQLRAVILVDLWNLLAGARGNLGRTAMTFDWTVFTTDLRDKAAASLSISGYRPSKADRVHLIDEGTYVYGAPAERRGSQIGGRKWMEELASLPGFRVQIGEKKPEYYDCRFCDKKMTIRRESGTDAHLISDLLWLAWQDRYDVAIVVSGDKDLIPSIERVQLSGRKVVVALFDGTSKRSRQTAHASVSLNAVLGDFRLYPGNPLERFIHGPPLFLDGARVMDAFLKLGHDVPALRNTLIEDLPSFLRDDKSWHHGIPFLKDVVNEEERLRLARGKLREHLDVALRHST